MHCQPLPTHQTQSVESPSGKWIPPKCSWPTGGRGQRCHSQDWQGQSSFCHVQEHLVVQGDQDKNQTSHLQLQCEVSLALRMRNLEDDKDNATENPDILQHLSNSKSQQRDCFEVFLSSKTKFKTKCWKKCSKKNSLILITNKLLQFKALMYLSKLQEVTSLFFKTACKDVLLLRLIKFLTSSLLQKFDVSAEEDVPRKKYFSSE